MTVILAAFMGLASTAIVLPTSAGAAPALSIQRSLDRPERVGPVPRPPLGARALGSLAATTTLHLDVVLQPRDPAALARFATDVSTPGSALYRHYLAPGQFPDVFGPTKTTVAEIEKVLRTDGLQLGAISANHLSIPVTATTGQIDRAFSISFRRFEMPGRRVGFANTAAPRFPGTVARLVQGVIGLDDLYLPRSLGLVSSPNESRSGSEPNVTGGPQPCAEASSVGRAYGSYTADQLASAYGFTSLYGAGDEGAGVTVALYELEPNLTADISAYQSCYGTSASVTYTKVDSGAGSGAGSGEAALDIEDVIGLAPKARIDVYQGPNNGGTGPYDTYDAIIAADTAQVISTSWGLCEPYASAVGAENTLFQEAATQGQSLFAAAGDSGSEDCDRDFGSTSLAVDDPASQPYVTGVGGTKLSILGPPPAETVWNESADGGGAGGGGVSANWTMPAYQADAPASLHVVNADSTGAPCGSTAGVYCREVPDVSADADPYTGYVIYYNGSWTGIGGTSAAAPLWAGFTALTDASSSCAGRPIGFANPPLYGVADGPSYSSAFQDITTGNNDYTGTNAGYYPAGTGYDMGSGLGSPDGGVLAGLLCSIGSSQPSVTTGPATGVSTGAATLHGTVNPNRSATTYFFEYGTTRSYGSTTTSASAGAGTSAVAATADLNGLGAGETYDFRLVATNSHGTDDGGNLTFIASSATTTDLVASPDPARPGARVTLTATVSPASAIGTVEFESGTKLIPGCAAAPLGSGVATCATSFGVPGSYRLSAAYGGSTDFAASTSATGTLVVAKAASRTGLKLSAAKITHGHEQAEILSVTVSPQYSGSAAPSGRVTIKGSTISLCVITLSSGTGSCALSSSRLAVGGWRLSATYGGNADFAASTSASQTLTVVEARGVLAPA